MTVGGAGNTTIGGIVSGTGGLTKDGGGTLTITSASTYYGTTMVSQGVLVLSGSSAKLSNSSNVIIVAGATLYLSGANGSGGNNQLTMAAGGVWNISGTLYSTTTAAQTMPGTVILNNSTMTGNQNCYDPYGIYYNGNSTIITANGSNNTISLPGPNAIGLATTLTLNTPLATDALAVSAVIGHKSGTSALTKSGLGTVTLNSNNTYTGATTINAGVLALGANGSISNTPTITIAAGAFYDVSAKASYTLYGHQTLLGGGTVTGNVTAVLSAKIAPAGTLTFASDLSLTSLATNLFFDLSVVPGVTNDLLVANNLNANTSRIAINNLNPTTQLTNGTYTLITYSGALGGAFDTVVAGQTQRQAHLIDTNTPGVVSLVLTGSAASALVWGPGPNNNWDLGTSNWVAGTDRYFNFDNVVFNETGAYSNIVNITTTVIPGSVYVTGASNYTFSGAGKISGATSLLKDGTGVLTLGTANNDFTGGILVSNGTVKLGAGFVLPLNNVTTITTGGAFDFAGFTNNNRNLTFYIAGDGGDGLGALRNTGGNMSGNLAGVSNLVLTANATIGGSGRFDIGYGVAASNTWLNGGGFTLTKVGANEISVRPEFLTNLAGIVVAQGDLYYENFSRDTSATLGITNYVSPSGRLGS